jgi:hypothetical protein
MFEENESAIQKDVTGKIVFSAAPRHNALQLPLFPSHFRRATMTFR